MKVTVSLSNRMHHKEHGFGQKYEVVVYPAIEDHKKVAQIIIEELEHSYRLNGLTCETQGDDKYGVYSKKY